MSDNPKSTVEVRTHCEFCGHKNPHFCTWNVSGNLPITNISSVKGGSSDWKWRVSDNFCNLDLMAKDPNEMARIFACRQTFD